MEEQAAARLVAVTFRRARDRPPSHRANAQSSFAAVPSTQVCMNCHSKVRADSQLLLPVRQSWASGNPIPWVKLHKAPDYV